MLGCKYVIRYLSYPKTHIQCRCHLLFHFCQNYKSKTQKVSKKNYFGIYLLHTKHVLYVTCFYSHNIYKLVILWTVFVLFQMFHTQTCFASSGHHLTLSFTLNSFFSRPPWRKHICVKQEDFSVCIFITQTFIQQNRRKKELRKK